MFADSKRHTYRAVGGYKKRRVRFSVEGEDGGEGALETGIFKVYVCIYVCYVYMYVYIYICYVCM